MGGSAIFLIYVDGSPVILGRALKVDDIGGIQARPDHISAVTLELRMPHLTTCTGPVLLGKHEIVCRRACPAGIFRPVLGIGIRIAHAEHFPVGRDDAIPVVLASAERDGFQDEFARSHICPMIGEKFSARSKYPVRIHQRPKHQVNILRVVACKWGHEEFLREGVICRI